MNPRDLGVGEGLACPFGSRVPTTQAEADRFSSAVRPAEPTTLFAGLKAGVADLSALFNRSAGLEE